MWIYRALLAHVPQETYCRRAALCHLLHLQRTGTFGIEMPNQRKGNLRQWGMLQKLWRQRSLVQGLSSEKGAERKERQVQGRSGTRKLRRFGRTDTHTIYRQAQEGVGTENSSKEAGCQLLIRFTKELSWEWKKESSNYSKGKFRRGMDSMIVVNHGGQFPPGKHFGIDCSMCNMDGQEHIFVDEAAQPWPIGIRALLVLELFCFCCMLRSPFRWPTPLLFNRRKEHYKSVDTTIWCISEYQDYHGNRTYR